MMQEHLSPACADLILTTVRDIKLGQELFFSFKYSKAVRSHGSLLHIRHFQFWIKSRGFHHLNHPSRYMFHEPRTMCSLTLEDTSVPQQGLGTRGVLPSQVSHDGRLSHGLGYSSRWPTSLWPLGVCSSETLPCTAEGLPCAGLHRL